MYRPPHPVLYQQTSFPFFQNRKDSVCAKVKKESAGAELLKIDAIWQLNNYSLSEVSQKAQLYNASKNTLGKH